MARYIDADKLLEELQQASDKEGVKADAMAYAGIYDASVKYGHGQYCYINAMEIVKDAPAVDVVEVKHGYWVRQEKMVDGKVQAEAVCSNCGTDVVYQVIDNRWQFENYCPHCGARMDGDT